MFSFKDQQFTRFIRNKRRQKHMTQADVSEATGISRAMIRNLELEKCVPTAAQLKALGRVLGFDVPDAPQYLRKNIVIASAGDAGLSLALLLAQYNHVELADARPESLDMLNARVNLFGGEESDALCTPGLSIAADGEAAYVRADYVIIDVSGTGATLAAGRTVAAVTRRNPQAVIGLNGTVPAGFARALRERTGNRNIFCVNVSFTGGRRYPAHIEIACGTGTVGAAMLFAELLKQGTEEDGIETVFAPFADGETENHLE